MRFESDGLPLSGCVSLNPLRLLYSLPLFALLEFLNYTLFPDSTLVCLLAQPSHHVVLNPVPSQGAPSLSTAGNERPLLHAVFARTSGCEGAPILNAGHTLTAQRSSHAVTLQGR